MDKFYLVYDEFDDDQKMEIEAGIQKGFDVSCYAKLEYLAIQMRQIRLGMESGIDVSVYNKPEYDWFQMEEIRLGMEAGITYELYAKPSIDYKRMRQIRKGLEDGIDLSIFIKLAPGILEELRKALLSKVVIVDYIKEGYVVEQLTEIRYALEKKIDIKPYITKEYRGAAIREIVLGLEAGLAVSVYSNLEYNWQQMQEIRLGMESRVDVSQYSNNLFLWQQMRELRLGLEDGLDINKYKKFIYTASDMEEIRKKLLIEEAKEIVEETFGQKIVDEPITIFISNDEMEACIEIAADTKKVITEAYILRELKKHGISQGILYDEIKKLVEERNFGKTIVIAKGQNSIKGKDGWYEFYFETQLSRTPKILEDGTADFKDVKWFEVVEENQKLAYYHSAEFGKAGFTVTGKFLKAKKGKEKNVLRGTGFKLEEDGRTYVAVISGKIVYDGESRIDISRMFVVEDVNLATGNINFDGSVYVKGNVGSGVIISASENIIVDGYVEAATLSSGAEVFLRRGVNGGGTGIIEAAENVVGQFFEDVTVVAGGDISGQYCMNCDLHSEGKISLVGYKGLLLGGKARAANGIHSYNIGNKMGLKTVLSVGIDQQTMRAQQNRAMKIENVNRELAILNHSKSDFQNKYAPEIRNTMEIYLKIENAIYTKEIELKQLLEESQAMLEKMEEMKGAQVTVKGTVYEGAEVTIDNAKWKAFTIKDVVLRCVNDKISMESQ